MDIAFDGRTGAAGDMILGALLAAGADRAALAPVERAIDVEYDVGRVDRAGVEAVDVTVRTGDGGHGDDDEGDHDHEPDQSDHADHPGDHAGHDEDDHDHPGDHADHDHPHDHAHAEGSGPTRTYEEVLDLVEGMALPERVRADALATFELLGEAEAAVHGTDLRSTTFHEVGADDAVADVVGAALLFDDLDADRVVTGPLAVGGGEVDTAHGTYPVPAPAVVEVAERAGVALVGGPVEAELLTPTGAAVLAHHADGVDRLPPMRVERSGYGAGDRDLGRRPNALRVLAGQRQGSATRESIAVLETNLDDAAPELLGGLQESLADAGALDVSVVPTTMKKSRPGHLVRVVTDPRDAERVARRLAVETGTLGVREAGADHRYVLDRRVRAVTVEVDGDRHEVDVKVATDADGGVVDVSAEFDDAAAVARETGVATREVMRRAETSARERLSPE
jgi:uncharacterized protein (TIGR00299 family) protein